MQADEFAGLGQLATELQDEIYGGLYAYAIAAGFEGYDLADSSTTTVIHIPKDSPVTPEKLMRYLEWTQPDRMLRLLARVAELTGRVEGLTGERDEGYRKGLQEALRMGEANAATLYIDLNVGTPSEATKNMVNGVSVALFPIKRELAEIDRARAALGEGNDE